MSATWFIELAISTGEEPRDVVADGLPITLGRAEDATVTLDDQRVSRLHARIEESPRGLLLVDLDSANGTFVGGERVQQLVVGAGDVFVIGDSEVRLVRAGRRTDPPADLVDKGLELGQELGEGLTCRVFGAHQRAMNRDVAVRFLLEEHVADAAVAQRFRERLREQSRVNHSGLASVIDFGEAQGVPYAVVERLPGRPLAEHLLAGWRPEGADVPGLLVQVLELLDHLHGQGRCLGHLDAEGLILDEEGHLRVTSLGQPLPSLAATPDVHRDALGWLAPETTAGGAPEVPGDLFLVGALGRRLLADGVLRRAPSTASMLEEVRGASLGNVVAPPGTPDALIGLLEDLTDPVPAARPGTAREVLDLLEPLARSAPPVAMPVAAVGPVSDEPLAATGRPVHSAAARRRLKRISWTITGVLMIVLNGALFWWLKGNDRSIREWLGGEERQEAPDGPGPESGQPVAPHAGSSADADSGFSADPTSEDPLEEAAARWRGVNGRLTPLLQERRFAEACTLLRDYIRSYGSAPHASRARERLQALEESWRAEVLPHLASLERALEAEDAEAAHAALKRAVGAGAEQTHTERLGTLRKELRALVARAAASPGPVAGSSGGTDGRRDPPGSAASAPKEKPLSELLGAALEQPGDRAGRKAALERLGEPGVQVDAGARRLLEGQERLFTALLATLPEGAGSSLQLELARDRRLDGVLLRVDVTALVLKIGEQERSFPWKELPLQAWPSLLERLPGNLDRYLVSGWIRCRTEEPVDAWFDLQAVLVLTAADPAARKLAESLLSDLGKRHGAR